MLLAVGLGNPGSAYANNRHNIGFMVVEAMAKRWNFGPWRARFQGQTADGDIDALKVMALKPGTFMNLSGQAVGEASRFFKIAPEHVFVFYDELELAPGRIKVKRGGGNAGHNGLKSIDAHIGVDYWRIRIGIGHPGDKNRVTSHVLSDFAKDDAAWRDPLIDAIAAAMPLLLGGDENKFMTKVALLIKPPAPRDSAKDQT
ncbi:MAG: aminoacyl-tRNA hydrolase [Alphaproteobacteria bacterium]|nr:aminoacyl-tRNA hydrolase [Alphaproteobacteria bacterium]